MKCNLIQCVCMLIFVFSIPHASANQPKQATDQQLSSNISPTVVKTLDRRFDPVVITGDLLAHVNGLAIENFRLFSHDGNQFQIIPFQIDERNPDGLFIFTDGESAGEDIDKGHFDYNDELVFMAKDSGCQVSKTEWTKLSQRGVEILITDPLDISKKGCVYLIYFPQNPPPLSKTDYVTYNREPGKEVVLSDYFKMGYKEGAPFYTDLSYPEKNGGNNEDFFDRIKIRIKVKALFNMLSVTKTEEDLRAVVVGWKDGPVRVLRYVQNYFRILFDLAEPSMFVVSEYYEQLMITPVQLTIPFNLKWVLNSFGISNFDWIFYGDLPGLKGGKAYTNKNRNGFQYTGNHPGNSFTKNLNTENLVWGTAAKKGVGTWFPCLIFPELLYGVTKFHAIDDDAMIDPPEDVPGVIGAGVKVEMADVNREIWSVLSKGTYELALDTYFPSSEMETEEVDEWLNIRGFPLSIELGSIQGKEIVTANLPTEIKKKSNSKKHNEEPKGSGIQGILTDIWKREFALDNITFYFGSAQVTPRNYVAVKTGTGKKAEYFLLEFKDLERIEHHVEEIEPITGMKNPMFQKLFKRDGEIIDVLGCKPCGFSGVREDGKKVFFWNTQIQSINFIDKH